MAFLKFMKKKDELLDDIDLDMPPEPPGFMEEEISATGPIDEELMPMRKGKTKKAKTRKDSLPELPPLPEMEEDELPPLPEIEEEPKPFPGLPSIEDRPKEKKTKEFLSSQFDDSEDLNLPPPPQINARKKGFFSFLKPKKAAEGLPLPHIGEEFPEIPPMEEKEEAPLMPELEGEISVPTMQPLKKEAEKPLPRKEIRGMEKKFITINDFRQVQSYISDVKDDLKEIDEAFPGLEEAKANSDKEYMGLYASLKDAQRKIMFVDKTLFKEESV